MPEPTRRTYHRGLDRAAIVASALGVLDRDGRSAVTMRAIAAELEVEPPSLYAHVRNKDDIVDGILDLVLDGIDLPPADVPWRDGLEAGFTAYRRALLAHPHAVPLLTERARRSTAQLRLVERSIGYLEAAGLDPAAAVQAQVALAAYTIGFVVQEVGRSPSLPGELLAASEVLSRAIPALLATTPDERFQAGLDLLLDAVAQRSTAGRDPGQPR